MLTLRKTVRLFSAVAAIVLVMQSFMSPMPAAARDITAQATTWFVSVAGSDANTCKAPAAPCRTIQAAIGKAAEGDTIKATTGTYNASRGGVVVLIGKNLTLSGGWNGAFTKQAGLSVIGGQGLRRGVTTTPRSIVTIDHFQVRNGSAAEGGGIYNTGTLTLSNSSVALNQGGGIYNTGTLTVNNSSVAQNQGSGIVNTNYAGTVTTGALTVNYSTISANTGGGIGIVATNGFIGVYATATINNSTIINNTSAGTAGAGIAIVAGDGLLAVNNSTLTGNAPGAILMNDGYAGIDNSTISGNTGTWAILGDGLNLRNTTITNNWGGISILPYLYNVRLQNSVVAGNSSDGGVTPNDCLGGFSSWGYNIVGSATGCGVTATAGDQFGTTQAPIDPKLGPLANNGGRTLTHALLADSPAINAGNPAAAGSGGSACPETDQRGRSRTSAPAGVCDIGAFESVPLGVASITRLDADNTSAPSVRFSVNFNDTVAGVGAEDFALTTGGSITGASLTGVAGSGNSFVVTVNTGSGAGTIHLDLVDDEGIVGASTGEPLGGAGPGNGDFTAGETYTIAYPTVISILRANANPTSAASVVFNVTFSTAVNGVNVVAPFPDFRLTTTGLSGATVTSVTGSGKTFQVIVNHGTGSGTLRLDVVDDGTVFDPTSGRRLGGPGLANGNFTSGQMYTIVPMPQSPSGVQWGTKPTFVWSALTGVTQYQLQVANGATLMYGYIAPASACSGSTCTASPPNALAGNPYQWRVRAYSGGAWRPWRPYKAFALSSPEPGYWDNPDSWISFYVLPNRVQIAQFTFYISVDGCGNYAITYPPVVPIQAGTFAFNGSAFATGRFDPTNFGPVSAEGTAGFNHYLLSGCGYISGTLTWNNYRIDGSQPDARSMQNLLILRVPDAPFRLFVPMTLLKP